MASLHVLVEPKHHPLQHPWVRRMRGLPPALRRAIADWSFAYRRHTPDLLTPSPNAELRAFEEELEAFEALDAETIALEFSRPLWDHGGRRDTAHLEREDVRGHIARAARAMGANPSLASLIYESPAELAERFVDFIRSYWAEAFAEEWERLEPLLAETVAERAGGSRQRACTTCSEACRSSSASIPNARSSASTFRTITWSKSAPSARSCSSPAPTSGRTSR